MKTLASICIVVVFAFLLIVALVPAARQDVVDRTRISGHWHLEGTFVDWQLHRDGTFIVEGPFETVQGTYELLSDFRLRTQCWTRTATYRYSFKDATLLLEGIDGNQHSYRLLPKKDAPKK